MDPKLLVQVNGRMPKFNETITNGFHRRDFENVEQIYERSVRMTFKDLEKKGVWFFGLHPVKPSEMFKFISASQGKNFQTNKESLYPVALHIGYGETREIAAQNMYPPTYVLLPFCDDYGDLWLKGTKYSLQIVLADRGLSVTKDDQIFVRVLGYKFKVGTEAFEYVQVHNEATSCPTSNIPINLPAYRFYKSSDARKPHPNKTPTPLLGWYVFAKHGFSETLKIFGECQYAIGERNAITQQYPHKDGWTIFTTTGLGIAKSVGPYADVGYAVAVKPLDPKRKGVIPTVGHQYVASLLYMFETFSSFVELDKIDDPYFWRMIIGYSSVKASEPLHNLMKQMDDHFDFIYESLDDHSIQKFAEQRIVVKNMFELFNYIIGNRTEIVKTSDKANMFHKELSSVEFTIDRLIVALHRFKHDIKNTTVLNAKKVGKAINNHIRMRDIDRASYTSNMKQEETPTDNPLTDYGLGVISQAKVFESQDRSRSSGFNANDPATAISASLIFAMSFQRITKPDPDSRGFLPPCAYLVGGRYLALNPKFRPLYEATVDRLTKRETVIK